MIEIDKNGTKVDLEFDFAHIRLGINFPCMLSICVTTNCKTSETEATEFVVAPNFISGIKRKLRTSAVLFPHKINQADLNVTIITRRGRKSAGAIKFDIERALAGEEGEVTEALVACPDKHASLTFSVRVERLVHLSINDNMTKSPLQKTKTGGASFYSLANYGQEASTNQSKQLNNSSYSLNINKREGRSQSPAQNVIFRFQAKKPDNDEQADNWSKQLPSSRDLNNSMKMEDSVLRNADEYATSRPKSKRDTFASIEKPGGMEVRRSMTGLRDKEPNSATKAVRDELISDLKTQIANLGRDKSTLQTKMTELSVDATLAIKENVRLKEDNAKFHRQLSEYKAIDVDELLANYEVIKKQYERAMTDLDKQEEEVFELKRLLAEKSQKVVSLEKLGLRNGEQSRSPNRVARPMSHTWANRLQSSEGEPSGVAQRFAKTYAITTEEDLRRFEAKFAEQIEREEFLTTKVRNLEQDKSFLETKVEETEAQVEELEAELQQLEFELENERVEAGKVEFALNAKIAADSEEWENKFTDLANEYKTTIVKLKDNNVSLQRKYEEMLLQLNSTRMMDEHEVQSRMARFEAKAAKLESLARHIEMSASGALESKAVQLDRIEQSLLDIDSHYRQQNARLSRELESAAIINREKLLSHKRKVEGTQRLLRDIEEELTDKIVEKVYSEKYLEYVLSYVEDHDNEHVRSINRLVDTFEIEKNVRKTFWDQYKASTDADIAALKDKYKGQREELVLHIAEQSDRLAEVLQAKAVLRSAAYDLSIQHELAEADLLAKIKSTREKKREYKRLLGETSYAMRNLEDNNTSMCSNYEIVLTNLNGDHLTLKERNEHMQKINAEQETVIEHLKSTTHQCGTFMQEISDKIKDAGMQLYSLTEDAESVQRVNKKLKRMMLTKMRSGVAMVATLDAVVDKFMNSNQSVKAIYALLNEFRAKIIALEADKKSILVDSQSYIEELSAKMRAEYEDKVFGLESQLSEAKFENAEQLSKHQKFKDQVSGLLSRFSTVEEIGFSVIETRLADVARKLEMVEHAYAQNKAQLDSSSTMYTKAEETYAMQTQDLQKQIATLETDIQLLNEALNTKQLEHEAALETKQKEFDAALSIKQEEHAEAMELKQQEHDAILLEANNNLKATADTLKAAHSEDVTQLHARVQDLEAQLSIKAEEIAALQEKCREMSAEHADKTATYESMMEDYKAQIELMETAINDLETENANLKDKMHLLEQSGSSQTQEMSALISKKDEELAAANDKSTALQKKCDELSREMENMKVKHEEESENLNIEIRFSQEKIEKLNVELNSAQQTMTAFEKEVLMNEREMEDLRLQIENIKTEREDAHKELKTAKSELEALRAELKSKDSSDRELETMNSELTSKIQHLESEIESNTFEVENLKSRLAESSASVSRLEDSEKRLTELINEKDSQLISEKEKLAKLISEVKELQDRLEANKAQLEAASARIAKSKSKKLVYKEQISAQSKENMEQAQTISQQANQIAALQDQSELHHQSFTDASTSMQEVQQQVKEAQAQNNALTKELEGLRHQLEMKESKIEHLKERLEQDKGKKDEVVVELQDKLEEAKKELIVLRDELHGNKVQTGKLETSMHLIEKERDELRAQLLTKDSGHGESLKRIQAEFASKEEAHKQESTEQNKNITKLQREVEKLTEQNAKLAEDIAKTGTSSENKEKEARELAEQLKQHKESIQDAEKTIQLKNNDVRHMEAQLAEKKAQVEALTATTKDLERRHSELDKEFVEFKHSHQSETEAYDRLLTENEILKQNAKFMESKSVDAKVVEKLTNKIEELEKQHAKAQKEAAKEQEDMQVLMRTTKAELDRRAAFVEPEVYQTIEKSYIDSMQKIGDALNIVKSLKLKQADKDKIIASLIV